MMSDLQVPHTLPIPYQNTKGLTHSMADYLTKVGSCFTAYPSEYRGKIQAGCHPTLRKTAAGPVVNGR